MVEDVHTKEERRMEFRDICCFKLALLAKQAYRLIDNPDPYVHRS